MTKVFYKATRPDRTDFRTGTVLYEVGSQLPFISKKAGVPRECCTSTVYHASDTPSETLIGGSWPARLFEVTGKPLAQEGHKFGFATLHVVREIEAWRVFGPNGQAVVALIGRASRLSATQLADLGAARDGAWYAAWYAARGAVGHAARHAAGDAAGALVVRDLITEEQFETLTASWVSVVGPL
jgi:hypothetical protein